MFRQGVNTSPNRFATFSQRELEILELALDRIDPHGPDGLPQHAAAMDLVRAQLVDELRPCQLAPSTSRDGSHFGEANESASHVTLCLSPQARKWLIRHRWERFCAGTRGVQTVCSPVGVSGFWLYVAVSTDGAQDLVALVKADGEFGDSHAFTRY